MRGLQKSKRVSWASDLNLCQVKLFLSDESPSQVGLGGQDHLQAKDSWSWHSGGASSDDNLPPGFEGIQPANLLQNKLSQIPVIQWKCPSRNLFICPNFGHRVCEKKLGLSDTMVELFDPRKMVTDYDCSAEEDCCDHCDLAFAFAFNDPNFSDRLLGIQVLSEPIESTPEEAAFMELLMFMYSSKLTVATAPDVLDVLKAADKFEVASCVRLCSRLLRNLPMTPESVLVYLDLPKTILTSEAFQPLTIAAKQFYAVHYKDITKLRKATLGLPLATVEAILASDDLQLKSENAVYRFVLDWALAHYPDYKERRDIIATRLAKFIRFPYMTRRMLVEVLTCPEFNPEFAQKVVKEALSFKSEVPTMEHTYIRDEYSILNLWFVERAYKARPIKMVEYEQPIPHCVVYFDLKRDVCASLSPSGLVKSEAFNLGSHRDHWFCLVARCNTDCFGLYLGMLDDDQRPLSGRFAFEYEFAAMSKRTNEFVSRRKGLCTFSYNWAIGIHDMFAIPWSSFIGEDSVYFVDGVLHLRAELTQLS